jgi:hypothetical protein
MIDCDPKRSFAPASPGAEAAGLTPITRLKPAGHRVLIGVICAFNAHPTPFCAA